MRCYADADAWRCASRQIMCGHTIVTTTKTCLTSRQLFQFHSVPSMYSRSDWRLAEAAVGIVASAVNANTAKKDAIERVVIFIVLAFEDAINVAK